MKIMKCFTMCMIVSVLFIDIATASDETINAIREMALEPYEEYHLYRGDLHVHTNYSADADSSQEINGVIQSARGRLDFIAITDHDEYKDDVLTKDEWTQIVAVCQKQNRDGEFIVIPGYEWTSPDQHFKRGSKDYEHKILYFDNPPDDIFRYSNFPTPEKLANAVSGVGGIGHTPHPRSFTVMDLKDNQIIVKHHERDYWDYGREFSSIFSNAEVYPDGPLYQYDFDKVDSDDIKEERIQISWELEIQKALSMGYRLGFIATSDTHWPNIKPGEDRRTVVFAKNLTREEIVGALKKRNNYAEVCPENVDVYFSVSGHIIGDEFETAQNPRLLLNIQSEREILEVYIYKNNNKWITINKGSYSQFSPDSKEVNFNVEDIDFVANSFYFVKIRLKGFNEYGTPFTVFTSPVWVNKRAEPVKIGEAKTLIDDTSFSLHFDNPPKRIISVSPSVTEILGVIDADTMLVGVSLYSYYPPFVKGLPKVGSYVKPNIEQIISLNPDLVIMSFDGAPRGDVHKLRRLNINVAVLRSEKLSDIIKNINWLGEVLQHQKQAKEAAGNLENRYEQIRSLVKELAKPNVFYSIALNPIVSVGAKSFINGLIHDAGGINITGDINQAYPKLTIESVIAMSPDVMVFSSGMGNELDMENQMPFWKRWKSIPAVRDQRFIEVDHDIINRPGPRVVEALASITQQLHPEKAEAIQRIMKNEKP